MHYQWWRIALGQAAPGPDVVGHCGLVVGHYGLVGMLGSAEWQCQ